MAPGVPSMAERRTDTRARISGRVAPGRVVGREQTMTAKRKAGKPRDKKIIGRSTKRKSPATEPEIGEPVRIDRGRTTRPGTERIVKSRTRTRRPTICTIREHQCKPKPARVRLDDAAWERVWSTGTPYANFDMSVNLEPYQRKMVMFAIERELRRKP